MIYAKPEEIEARSFEIIGKELEERRGSSILKPPLEEAVVRRVIHTTADFDFDENIVFTHDAAKTAFDLLRSGVNIVTDTMMALTGINKTLFSKLGGAPSRVHCFISDADVATAAKSSGATRASASVDKAASLGVPLMFVIGNAPTALIRLHELMRENKMDVKLVIAAPVGFVNVVESKELFLNSGLPCIITRGRKGGSAVAASIVNALLYFNPPNWSV